MKIKCGRKEYEVGVRDFIMDNGACYQLILECDNNFREPSPRVSKQLFNKLIKEGKIEKSHEEERWCKVTYYRFVK